MFPNLATILTGLALALAFAPVLAAADDYQDTIKVFTNAGESGTFFKNARGYAVFPTVGKGGVGIGGAHGSGRVYEKGMATFTVAKGGLMYEASVGGQKFSYKPL